VQYIITREQTRYINTPYRVGGRRGGRGRVP